MFVSRLRRSASLVGCIAALLIPSLAFAAAPRVLPAGQQPEDVRLQPPKDLDGYFPFTPPATKEEWATRAERVKRQILVSQGLWPLPTKTPLNQVIHGKVDKGDYTVERVYFESMPGFFVTGSLYRPKKVEGKVPVILSPHGHWANGRFHDAGEATVKQYLSSGAEKLENAAHSPLQARQVHMARMGCVAFHYDMLGYADSQQLSFDLVHRFGKQRPEMTTTENWGLYSPQAEANLQSVMGLQTWNSIRALDFVLSLPEVDDQRVAVSGASGGGTQTFLLAAVDPRVTLSFPAVMVSTAMQGGCTCENSSCLRVNTGNIEFAALFAPKAQGMTAADDWTKEMSTKGFPELKIHYERLGAPENVLLHDRTEFPHNYNLPSRVAFYGLLNKHFKLGLAEPIEERDFELLTQADMTVWGNQNPQPPGGDAFEKKLAKYWHDDAAKHLAAAAPKDKESLAKWKKVAGGGLDAIIGRGVPAAAEQSFELKDKTKTDSYVLMTGLLTNKTHGEQLPLAFIHPKTWNGRAVIWLSEQGKNALFTADGKPSAEAQKLIEQGISVVGVDLFGQGEFAKGDELVKNQPVKNPREFAGYTYGYNHSLLARRAHDVLSVISFVKHNEQGAKTVELVALDDTAPAAAVALAQAGDSVTRAALDTRSFRFLKLTDYLDANFLPGGAKYGDLPGILALAAPTELWLAGETAESAALTKQAYDTSGGKLTLGAQPGAALEAILAAK